LLSTEWFPNTQRNRLKRLNSPAGAASETATLRVLIEAGAPVETMEPAEMRNWMRIVHCMALMSAPGRDPHSTANNARPGYVLHSIGYGEQRLGCLLDARDETLHRLLDRAARRMSRAGGPVNWSRIAPLVLATDARSPWAENARIAISRDYLLAAARSSLWKGKDMAADKVTTRRVAR
jgi:CRISPR type I-E-associated protein CasB/Cse2